MGANKLRIAKGIRFLIGVAINDGDVGDYLSVLKIDPVEKSRFTEEPLAVVWRHALQARRAAFGNCVTGELPKGKKCILQTGPAIDFLYLHCPTILLALS